MGKKKIRPDLEQFIVSYRIEIYPVDRKDSILTCSHRKTVDH